MVLDQASGELVERSTFYGYGGTESDYRPGRWEGFRSDYRFTGKEEDVEVGLTYFGKRYLNAQLGRWVSADPLGVHAPGKADWNLYAYVSGALLKAVDPVGLRGEDVSGGAVGRASGQAAARAAASAGGRGATAEQKFRTSAVKGAAKIARGGCCGLTSDDPNFRRKHASENWLNKRNWVQHEGDWNSYRMKEGVKASRAIRSIFRYRRRMGSKLDCERAMVAVWYRAMLKTVGRKRFNEMFSGENAPVIGPVHERPTPGEGLHQNHPIWKYMNTEEREYLGDLSNLERGDSVYLKNAESYRERATRANLGRNNPWTGEYTVYAGNDRFFGHTGGFALRPAKYERWMKRLAGAHGGVSPSDVPGVRMGSEGADAETMRVYVPDTGAILAE